MIYTAMDEVLAKVDKYTLAVLVAKRARELVEGGAAYVDSASTKPVTLALEEIAQGEITYERTKAGIK